VDDGAVALGIIVREEAAELERHGQRDRGRGRAQARRAIGFEWGLARVLEARWEWIARWIGAWRCRREGRGERAAEAELWQGS
jgi:hypothetical protein